MKSKRKFISMVTLIVMLFSMCACGTAPASTDEDTTPTNKVESVTEDKEDTSKDAEKEEKKSAFIVEINGKEYDLAGNYMTLLSEFVDDGVLVLNPTNLYPYEKDGSLGEHRNDEEFYELFYNKKFIYMSENLLFGDLIYNEYGVFVDVEGNSVQESVQELINTEGTGKYIYADGKLVDLAQYYEMVQKEKEENKTLFELSISYALKENVVGSDWIYFNGLNGPLQRYHQEHREEMEQKGIRFLSMRSDITVSEVLESIPEFKESLAFAFACQDQFNKMLDNQIEWFGVISGSSTGVTFEYYDNDAELAKEKAERNGWDYE